MDREAGEEFQEDTSKVQPQQEIAFSLKTISTSEPAKVRIQNWIYVTVLIWKCSKSIETLICVGKVTARILLQAIC